MKYDRNAAGYARSPAVPAPDSSVRSRFGRRNAALIEQRAVLGLVARRAIVLESHARAASSLRRIVFDELHVTTHESRTVLQLVDIDIGLLVALRSDRLLSDRSGERILRLRRGRSRSGPFERAGRFRSRRLRRRSDGRGQGLRQRDQRFLQLPGGGATGLCIRVLNGPSGSRASGSTDGSPCSACIPGSSVGTLLRSESL